MHSRKNTGLPFEKSSNNTNNIPQIVCKSLNDFKLDNLSDFKTNTAPEKKSSFSKSSHGKEL